MTGWIIASVLLVIVLVIGYCFIYRCWKSFVRSHYWSHVGEAGPIPKPEKRRFLRRIMHSTGG